MLSYGGASREERVGQVSFWTQDMVLDNNSQMSEEQQRWASCGPQAGSLREGFKENHWWPNFGGSKGHDVN